MLQVRKCSQDALRRSQRFFWHYEIFSSQLSLKTRGGLGQDLEGHSLGSHPGLLNIINHHNVNKKADNDQNHDDEENDGMAPFSSEDYRKYRHSGYDVQEESQKYILSLKTF